MMKQVLVTLFLAIACSAFLLATEPDGRSMQASHTVDPLPILFIENQGQIDSSDVKYYVRDVDRTYYFTSQGMTVALTKNSDKNRLRWALMLEFVDSSSGTVLSGEQREETVVSCFRGKPEEWRAGIATFSTIAYEDLWPGIDLRCSGTARVLKYEFIVEPGVDPGQIRLSYNGASAVFVNNDGALCVETPAGRLTDGRPVAYQKRNGVSVQVPVAYAVPVETHGGAYSFGFDLADYDQDSELVIDPSVFLYCGYIGGIANDELYDIQLADDGSTYVVGNTQSEAFSFPATVGPDLSYNGGVDAFIAKVKPSGDSLAYCG